MKLTLLIDFGSTYTKIVAVDLAQEEVVARTQAPSTVGTDITLGLNQAISEMKEMLGVKELPIERKIASSSAAGGLRMAAIGLVPELTAEAANRAALGAGAKVIKVFSYELAPKEIEELERLSPDMVLLAGGVDGGNSKVLLHNAEMLAACKLRVPIVIAGNKVVADQARDRLTQVGKYARVVDNVLPSLNELNVKPARQAVRDLFMERIVKAKGLDKATSFVGDIIMPTPMAVLNGAELLAEGTEDETGIGELVVVDVGGATTDVCSIASGTPTQPAVVIKGLPEPYSKRTVEGDLGIRSNADSILEMAGKKHLVNNMPPHDETLAKGLDLEQAVEYRRQHVNYLPQSRLDVLVDLALARTAVEIAVNRHAGIIEPMYTPMGTVYVQHGKDLTPITKVIATGGIFAHGEQPEWILGGTLYSQENPLCLKPKEPEFFTDELYILYAVGLLKEVAPTSALRIMKKHLKKVDGVTSKRN